MEIKPEKNLTTFANVTLFNTRPFEVGVLWNILFFVSVLSMLNSLYLFIALILYVVQKLFTQHGFHKNSSEINVVNKSFDFKDDQGKKLRRVLQSRLQNAKSSMSMQFDYRKSTTAKCKNQVLHFVLLITLGVNLLRGIVELLLFFVGGHSDGICKLLTSLMIVFTGFAMHGSVWFLWMRQHIFYSNPVVEHLGPKGKKYISILTYLEMVITLVTIASIHLWWRDYTASNGLCRPLIGSQKISPVVAFGMVTVSTVFTQISLTYLFVYPQFVHKKRVKKLKKVAEKSRSTAQLVKCIKRALTSATIGITTDVVGSVASMMLPEDLPVFVLSVIYELDINLNILCIFYTYPCWKKIVFPWRQKKNKLTQSFHQLLQ